MTYKVIKDKIIKAYKLLLKNDGYLFIAEANERSITHKFAEYLQLEFLEYNVDCEYNRNGLDIKKLDSFKKNIMSDDIEAVSVFPDIIIHHRGTKNNFIVIEAKKSTNKGDDNKKLLLYKKDLGYKYAFAIQFLVAKKYEEYRDISLKDLVSGKKERN